MKKYFDRVKDIIATDPAALIVALLVMVVLHTIPYFISYGLFKPDAPLLVTSLIGYKPIYETTSIYPPLLSGPALYSLAMLSVSIFSIIVSVFTTGAILSYLDSWGKHERSKLAHFFVGGFQKMGRMLGANFFVLLFTVAAGLVLGISISPILKSIAQGDLTVVFKPPLYSMDLLISTLVATLFVYIPFEVALTNTPVINCIRDSFVRIKKVFWKMFGVSVLVYFVGTLLSFFAYLSPVASIIVTILADILIPTLATIFLIYPIYKHAMDISVVESRVIEV